MSKTTTSKAGPKLGNLKLGKYERSILQAWGMHEPFIGRKALNFDDQEVYVWHGDPMCVDEVPVLAVSPFQNIISVNQKWCFGVVQIEGLRIPTTEECIAAAEYPAFSDGSHRTHLDIAINQLSSWLIPEALSY